MIANTRLKNDLFEVIVSDYIRDHRDCASKEIRYFEREPSLTAAIRQAAQSSLPNGMRQPHQRRIPKAVLDIAERQLQLAAANLNQAQDFTELYRLVENEIGIIRGVGPLTVYDVAHRIGTFLGKRPTVVYLHAGTKAGAAALGLRGAMINTSSLPAAFSRLTAAEIEDCLCIYKDELQDGKIRSGKLAGPRGCVGSGSPRKRKC